VRAPSWLWPTVVGIAVVATLCVLYVLSCGLRAASCRLTPDRGTFHVENP
jgi:hypothetical protein